MEPSTHDTPAAAAVPQMPPPVRLRAAAGPMLPAMANHVALDASANTAYLNFGFVEPQAVAQAMAAGSKAEVEGLLVARLAIPVDALAMLHMQTASFLQSLQSQVGDMLATLAKGAKPDAGAAG